MRQRKGLSVWNVGDKEYHKLYDTVIVDYNHDSEGRTVTLNTGGWKTNHTKNCMNDFLKRFGFKVSQMDFVWYVTGREVSFMFDVDKVTFTVIDTPNGWQIGNYKEEVIRSA
jgi:hypothetical protein